MNVEVYVFATLVLIALVNCVATLLWDGPVLLAEYNAAGTRLQRYDYLPDDVVPAQVQDANGTYFVQADHLRTPRLMTGSKRQANRLALAARGVRQSHSRE